MIYKKISRFLIKSQKNLKLFSKIFLKVILSVQLCFIPSYGYAQNNSNSSSNEVDKKLEALSTTEPASPIYDLLEKLKTQNHKNNPEFLHTLQEIINLATAIEQGTEIEYLKQNPQIKEKRDYFLLANQKAESIAYHVDEGKVVEIVEQVVHLNDYTSRSIHTVFNSVGIKYNNESKHLFLKGLQETPFI